MASCSRKNVKDKNVTDGESDDSDYVPCFDGNDSVSGSVDLDSSGSGSDSDDSSDDSISSADIQLQQCRVWCDVDMHNIPPPPPRFPFTGKPGVAEDVDSTCKPLECFELYFDHAMIEIVVRETNRYAEQFISKNPPKERSLYKTWTPTTENEIRLFLGILILQGIVKLPRQEWYWSKRKVLHSSIFPELMSRNRFLLLMKFLHFANNDSIDLLNHPNPKLWKFFEIMEHLRRRFRDVYVPEEFVSLDESLMLYKGRLGWKMFNAKKKSSFWSEIFCFV